MSFPGLRRDILYAPIQLEAIGDRRDTGGRRLSLGSVESVPRGTLDCAKIDTQPKVASDRRAWIDLSRQ